MIVSLHLLVRLILSLLLGLTILLQPFDVLTSVSGGGDVDGNGGASLSDVLFNIKSDFLLKGDGDRDNLASIRFNDGDEFVVEDSLKFSISYRRSDDNGRPVATRFARLSNQTSSISNEGLYGGGGTFKWISNGIFKSHHLPRIWIQVTA